MDRGDPVERARRRLAPTAGGPASSRPRACRSSRSAVAPTVRWWRGSGPRRASSPSRRRRTGRTRRSRTVRPPRRGRGRPSLYASRRPCLTALRSGWDEPPGPTCRRRYPSGGREPSNAVPTRRCVAPCGHRGLQVPAHPGGHDRRRRVRRAAVPRPPAASRANASSGSASSGATAITPARSRAPAAATASASAGTLCRAGAAPCRRRRTRSTCTRTPQPAAGRGRRPVQRGHQPGAVDRVHDVAAAGHHGGLVGLHLADEVPDQVGQAGRAALLGLRRRLLARFSPTSRTPSAREMADVAGREGLGDRDQGDLGRGRGRRPGRRPRSAPRPVPGRRRSRPAERRRRRLTRARRRRTGR